MINASPAEDLEIVYNSVILHGQLAGRSPAKVQAIATTEMVWWFEFELGTKIYNPLTQRYDLKRRLHVFGNRQDAINRILELEAVEDLWRSIENQEKKEKYAFSTAG
jgi:hypothetical protein